jgi:DNA-binding NtrC family response regulator
VTDLAGAIDVSTRLNEGTAFEVYLPAAGETTVPAPEADRTLPGGSGETIMIVDDERPLVALAEEIIAGLGYEPVGFGSSSAALEAFRATPDRFDAVLTDEAMRDLTGTELARELRKLRPGIPVILMTGYGDRKLMGLATEIGVNEVLRKPLRRHELADSLSRTVIPPSR